MAGRGESAERRPRAAQGPASSAAVWSRGRTASRSPARASSTSRVRPIRTTTTNTTSDNPMLTDTSGNFALTALPGPGLLAVEAPTSDFIRVAVTGPAMLHSLDRSSPWLCLDRPAGGEGQSDRRCAFTLRKGVKLEARLVGPTTCPSNWSWVGAPR